MRLTKFEQALAGIEALCAKHGRVGTLSDIAEQLDYLIGVEKGKITDRSLLPNLTLGRSAARDIEALDMKLAELLYWVDTERMCMIEE